MPIEGELEQQGVADLLLHETNIHVLVSLARGLIKGSIENPTNEEALEILFKYMPNVHFLLHKKSITKEILFQYVHSNQIPVSTHFTKDILINKIIDFWERGGHIKEEEAPSSSTNQSTDVQNTQQDQESLFERQFAEEFYQHYNALTLKVEDFWKDAQLQLEIKATDFINEEQCSSAKQVLETLIGCKQQFNLFFKPELKKGVRGQMDVCGRRIVTVCGLLYKSENRVGGFQTSFLLIRDPSAKNDLKIRAINSVLHSQESPRQPFLCVSDTPIDTRAILAREYTMEE